MKIFFTNIKPELFEGKLKKKEGGKRKGYVAWSMFDLMNTTRGFHLFHALKLLLLKIG